MPPQPLSVASKPLPTSLSPFSSLPHSVILSALHRLLVERLTKIFSGVFSQTSDVAGLYAVYTDMVAHVASELDLSSYSISSCPICQVGPGCPEHAKSIPSPTPDLPVPFQEVLACKRCGSHQVDCVCLSVDDGFEIGNARIPEISDMLKDHYGPVAANPDHCFGVPENLSAALGQKPRNKNRKK